MKGDFSWGIYNILQNSNEFSSLRLKFCVTGLNSDVIDDDKIGAKFAQKIYTGNFNFILFEISAAEKQLAWSYILVAA